MDEDTVSEAASQRRPSPIQLSTSWFSSTTSLLTATEIQAATAAAAAALNNNNNATPQQEVDDPLGRGKRRSPVGTTTARKKKMKKTQTKIKLGCHIYSTRKTLFLCGLLNENQQNAIRAYPQNFRLHGTVKSGKGKVDIMWNMISFQQETSCAVEYFETGWSLLRRARRRLNYRTVLKQWHR